MMDYREILRLRSLGFSQRQMERDRIVSRDKAREIFRAADRAGIQWPIDEDITNEELELLLFPGVNTVIILPSARTFPATLPEKTCHLAGATCHSESLQG